MKKINIAVVGLDFGRAFCEIYAHHPYVESVGVYDPDKNAVRRCMEEYGGTKAYNSFEGILNDANIDAVHLVTPIPMHTEQTIKVLKAGKHCACAVPMATSLEDIRKIVEAVRESGKKYMMMETALYTYNYLYAKHMRDSGELGRIQFIRGDHYQDMTRWPGYWKGLPPMHYGTHAISPMAGLADSRIKRVICLGSGTMDKELHKQYNNPYPVESALVEFESGLKGEVTRILFETARQYREGFSVCGSKASFEWGFFDVSEPLVSHFVPWKESDGRINRVECENIKLPNFYKSLPRELWRFTVGKNYDPLNEEESLAIGDGGGHLGSHPHLVDEFVKSIVEDRRPAIDEVMSANITAAGICAHESAMKNGEPIIIPEF